MKKLLTSAGLIIGAVVVMACGDGRATFPNRDGIPNNCEYADGAFYQPNHMARFDNNHRRLMLIDWNTGEDIFELDTNIDAARTEVLEWSPNCQYLITHQGSTGIIYDVVNGKRLAAFDKMRGYNRHNPSAVFDQTSTYLTVEAGGSTYFHHLQTGHTVKLLDDYFQLQYFDPNRSELIGINENEVAAYDINSGAKVASFGDLDLGRGAFMTASPDDSVVLFGSGMQDKFFIFNRNTMLRLDIPVGYASYDRTFRIGISPDNRYVVVGKRTVKVWDLQNLRPVAGSYVPPNVNFDLTGPSIQHLHFLDNATIETITAGGTRYWNVMTGEEISR